MFCCTTESKVRKQTISASYTVAIAVVHVSIIPGLVFFCEH